MKPLAFIAIFIPLLLLFGCVDDKNSATPQAVSADALQKDENALLNYSYGYLIGQRAGEALDTIDFAVFSRGLYEAINSATSTVSAEKMMQAVESYGKKKQEQEQAKQQELAAANLAQSEEFLREFEAKEGVKALTDGVLYRVLTAAKQDAAEPTDADKVKVHYKGTLVDGTVFDSSYERGEPVEFGLGDVIQGWQIALRAMKVGDKWEVALPPAVAYGESGIPGVIPGNATLVFEIELLEIVKQ